MKQQKLLLSISNLLSRFKVQVGILNANSMLDINVVSEFFLIPLLNEIYDCDFTNANLIKKNYPAVDLVDRKNKIAIQITSTSSVTKVRKTLEKIIQNNLQKIYNNFFIIIITSKQEKYNTSILDKATQGRFQFTNDNVIDVEGLFQLIASLGLTKIEKIEEYLKSQFTDVETTNFVLNTNIPSIINKIDNPQDEYLKSKLKTAYNARQEWYEKKAYLETNLPSISDLNQKFSIEKQISECNKKILIYEKDIVTTANQINNE
ncbi:SMEK domain-containing protein [Arcticibacterium luteifluviistationis]|uniref:SMEK domain-containing protein n=1 Tax=Arcticibacterium luteifluviistationis TaxID=1784714 RepID=A0A2Z4G7F1_9BACT|nr:SMEK domain-containing protein [Arcticibacterium luteifluviistationis]AWV97035.1 hypothetical protein DJ013_02115 [Arcticibacterium luteifluviistationis]